MNNLEGCRITIGTRDGEISNITIDTSAKQFKGFVFNKSGDMAIKFFDFNSELGNELMNVIKKADLGLYNDIKRSEQCS
jgi:hypothetical protein